MWVKGLKKIINSTLLLGMQLRMFYLLFSFKGFWNVLLLGRRASAFVSFPCARIEAFLGGNDLEMGSAAGLGDTSHWGPWLGITCLQAAQNGAGVASITCALSLYEFRSSPPINFTRHMLLWRKQQEPVSYFEFSVITVGLPHVGVNPYVHSYGSIVF